MRERSEKILKLVCLALAALLLYQVAHVLLVGNPLARVTMPVLPSLPAEAGIDSAGGKGTNPAPVVASGAKGTNNSAGKSGATSTNPPSASIAAGTNKSAALPEAAVTTNTNAVVHAAMADTNKGAASLPHEAGSTNTNSLVRMAAGSTNAVLPKAPVDKATNATLPEEAAKEGTNSKSSPKTAKKDTNSAPARAMAMAGMDGALHSMPGKKPADLPPAIQARVERISDSEMLGPVIRPLPMGLLGIAGNVAFLRAPSGQTGLVKEGDELGGLKLLRIGINRVLIEQEGQKKELTLFSGYGGPSLLSKPQDTPNEPTNR
jgi:hypothetical protein